MSEKTEQPTAKKLRDARKNGQLPRSRLLSAGAVTLGGVLGMTAFADEAAARLQGLAALLFIRHDLGPVQAGLECLWTSLWLLAPVLGGAFLAALAVSTATAGLQLNPAHALPRMDRLSVASGMKRVFSGRQWVDSGKNLLIAALVALLLWGEVADAGKDALRAIQLEGGLGLMAVLGLIRPALLKLCVVVGVLGGLDYLLARHRHIKDLMMSREEVKQEFKTSEGDPEHKAKRKSLHRALANQGPARGVHKATAVVVNPTHIAVALRYEPEECEAPYIVAKGRDQEAFAIRREAKSQGVPVVKDIPLARSLIHYDVGEEIPEELYRAAAAVLKAAMDDQ